MTFDDISTALNNLSLNHSIIKEISNIENESQDSVTATGLEPTTTKFVYELSGCGFESSCSHLNFRFRACFEQGVP